MMDYPRCFLTILGLLTAGVSPFARSDSGISINADVDSAIVAIDGVVAGKTPLRVDGLTSGLHQIRVLHPDIESWVSPVILDSVHLAEGEVRDLAYRFTRNTFVMTEPSGAEVLLGSKVVGKTPLLVQTGDEDSLLQVRLYGYGAVSIDPGQAERGVVRVRLDRAPGDLQDLPNFVGEEEGRSPLPLILSGASSVVAGGFSVYFKVQADKVYGEYLLTGDPVKLAETRKLDSVAGIALGAAEIYFALFSYLLLTQ